MAGSSAMATSTPGRQPHSAMARFIMAQRRTSGSG